MILNEKKIRELCNSKERVTTVATMLQSKENKYGTVLV